MTGSSEELRRAALDALDDVFYIFDKRGRLVDWNERAEELYGYSGEELEGKRPTAFFRGRDKVRIAKAVAKVFKDGEARAEAEFVTAEGERVPMEFNSKALKDEEGDTIGFSGVGRDISERKEREEKLQERERELQDIIDGMKDAVFIHRFGDEFLAVNDTAAERLGYTEEQLLSMSPYDINPESQERSVGDKIQELRESGGRIVEAVHETRDGKHVPVEISSTVIDYKGEEAVLSVARDISDRLERQDRLQYYNDLVDELERYHQLFENVPVGVYRNTPGPEGEFIEVNPAMVDIFEAGSKEELMEYSVSDLYSDPEEREEFSGDLCEEGSVRERELKLVTLGGREFWASVTAIRGEDDDGRVYFDGVVEDVTEWKEFRQRLREQKEFTDNLISAVDDLVYVLDADGHLLKWNLALNQVTGYGDEEIASMSAHEFFEGEERVKVAEAVEEGFRTGHVRVESEIATRDGDRVPYEFDATAFEDPDGNRVLAGVGRDVSDRREYEERLERKNEQLEVLNRLVRHDIRNDMNVILAYSWDLEESLSGEAAEKVETISSTGEHVVELTELARSFVEALRKGEGETGDIPLGETLEEAVESRRNSFEEAEFILGETPEVEVEADELLANVFNNLLNNSVQHNDRENPEVHVEVEESGDAVVISIADDGPGVPDSRKETIFGKGEKGLDSEGTGIGLYLVNSLVQSYGGEVWVEDNEPRGSVFNVKLEKA